MLVTALPQPRKEDEQDRVDQDCVGNGKERDGAGAEGQRRNGDERVRRVNVAADQKPGDNSSEAPAAETPFVQLVEVALAPMRGRKAKPGYKGKQQHENDQCGPIYFSHGIPPVFLCRAWRFGEACWTARSGSVV